MHMKSTLTAVAVALALTAGCGQSAPPGETTAAAQPAADAAPQQPAMSEISDQTLVTVNGRPITAEMFGVFFNQRLKQTKGAKNTPQMQNQAINELISIMLLAQEARSQGIDKRHDVATALALQSDQLLSRVALQEQAQQLEPTEDELKRAYDEFITNQAREEYKARHILVKTEDEAKQLIGQLDGGADFAELAKEHSTGPTGKNGGELGWFGPNQMVKPFTEAVQAMSPGSHSEKPVQTQFGWHVILLEQKREKEPPTFEAVEPQLKSAVQRQKLAQYVNSLKEKAKVELNESLVKAQKAGTQPASE